MRKKIKIKKKPFIILFIVVCLVSLLLVFNKANSPINMEDKLSKLGYSSSEVKTIMKNVPKDEYKLILKKYNKSLVNLLSSKDYKEENFKKYIEYYEKNPKASIEDIIVIMNSKYNLMKYPASSLLASLVKEKYYIHRNVIRYLDYGNSHEAEARKIISIVNSKADYKFYTDTKEANVKDGNLILVNKFYHLPDKYEPDDLVTLTEKYNQGVNNKMRKEAADAFMKMVDGAMLDSIILKNSSAYRSYDYQVNLYDRYAKRDGKEKADIYSARPGYSEHQTGLCSDINKIDSSFANTKEAKWLAGNAYKYGFILRFPKGKEDITGYKYEPWHFRYVGIDAAKVIYDNNLTLEEYYAYYIEK